MKTNSRLTHTFFALITAASVAACGADDKESKEEGSASAGDPKDPKPVVEMMTSMGSFRIELNQKDSPITVENFLKYVDKKHYDNTVFHRVMSTFMIQGGGFEMGDTPIEKDTLAPIRNEAKINGLKNEKYTIAMARTNAPHSATSQFFINVVDNRSGLDAGGFSPDGYAVFGKVIDGTDVVDKIKGVPVTTKQLNSRHGGQVVPGPHQNVPVEAVVIESVR
ncbi:MAG: cyclophilin family peptidyl-prolyl cis-trans isomerase, partial [Verrucomicrobiales bacterium]